MAELPIGHDIVAYCRGPFCMLSDEALKLLAGKGYRVRKILDGVAEWPPVIACGVSSGALKHSVHQIATDNSQKIPQRWPPSALAQLDSGGSAEHLAFAAAVWMRCCLGEDERGGSYALTDPMAAVLQATAKQHQGDAPATVKALLGIVSIWGNLLPQDARWTPRVPY